jgi:predicted DNA-binding transcriptional regulator AlpA
MLKGARTNVRKEIGMEGPLVDVEGAAKRLTLSESYLNKLRVCGGGPSFIKVGRLVRYRVSDLDQWAASQPALESTSEKRAA